MGNGGGAGELPQVGSAGGLGEGRGDALIAGVVCPRDQQPLRADDERLVCSRGHYYRYETGIPVLLLEEAEPTQADYWALREEVVPSEDLPPLRNGEIDPYVLRILRGTCGNLYGDVESLPRYPIPELRLPDDGGRRFLELGSNWGRWCIAAARKGYTAVGIDPSLGAARAARRVALQLGIEAEYVVADARFLPFPEASFDIVFSYSVLQHLSPRYVRAAVVETARVLKPGGTSLHQLPNRYGTRNLYLQARRGFRRARAFEVRYWGPRKLLRVFDELVGPTRLEADGFFSLNPQATDLDLVPRRYRPVLRASEALRGAPMLRYVADSLYVVSTRRLP